MCWFEIFVKCFRYEKYHGYYGGEEEERKNNYTDMVRDTSINVITSLSLWEEGCLGLPKRRKRFDFYTLLLTLTFDFAGRHFLFGWMKKLLFFYFCSVSWIVYCKGFWGSKYYWFQLELKDRKLISLRRSLFCFNFFKFGT